MAHENRTRQRPNHRPVSSRCLHCLCSLDDEPSRKRLQDTANRTSPSTGMCPLASSRVRGGSSHPGAGRRSSPANPPKGQSPPDRRGDPHQPASSLPEPARRMGELAERVGFEPTEWQAIHLISSQARSTGLRHLSAAVEASRLTQVGTEAWRAGGGSGEDRADRVDSEASRRAMIAGSRSSSAPCEPRQVRKEAAVAGSGCDRGCPAILARRDL